METPATAVDWRPFGPAAFEAATSQDRPLLLSLTATWCRECHEMDREVYADADLAAAIEAAFVPVRADVDRRPRVRDRYNMGGFPSTVFLAPAGEVLTGATYLNPDGFESVLDRVGEVWAESGGDAGRVPRALRDDPPEGDATDDVEALVAGQLRAQFDHDYGGWGTDAKFPLPRTIEFALKREPDLATRTLDPIRGHLLDTHDGGFFRYARNRDWSAPERETLAGEHAALLRAFANAYLHTGEGAYRETAADAASFLATTLWTGEAVAGSRAPLGPDYYRLSPSERESAADPPVDATAFADRNAIAADALLSYHAYTDDGPAGRFAERILDYLEGELIDAGNVRHYADPDAPAGLLFDHAHVAGAFARAAQVLDRSYADTAAAVADAALETCRGEGGFADGPREGAGLLDRPLYSIDANAAFADALIDLGALTGADRYRVAARGAIETFAGARERFGVQVAAYATAAARLDGSLKIEVATPTGSDLHRAALRIADHEKIVVPEADGDAGTATAFVGARATEPATTPAELASRVAAIVE